jgi:hypothetical protein
MSIYRHFAVFALILTGLASGYFVSSTSSQFPFYASEVESSAARRDPAAIKRVYDFSNLQGNALSAATKERLIAGARILEVDNEIGVELGHFVIRDQDGNKIFACQKYKRIELVFEGDGSAVAGQLPSMEVEGDCQISTDINKIAALWIPVKRILGESVGDGEFDFREGRPVKVRFSNVSDSWPKLWRLQAVRLFSSEDRSEFVEISPPELRQVSADPILVRF